MYALSNSHSFARNMGALKNRGVNLCACALGKNSAKDRPVKKGISFEKSVLEQLDGYAAEKFETTISMRAHVLSFLQKREDKVLCRELVVGEVPKGKLLSRERQGSFLSEDYISNLCRRHTILMKPLHSIT